MTMAIRWGQDDPDNQGLIYLDAVTYYSESHTGQVTKHPVDTGSVITDHFVRDNSKFTLSAVITGVDISNNTYLITDGQGNYPLNTSFPVNSVSVNSTDDSVLRKFIPDSIGQFLPVSTPTVVMDGERTDLMDQIKFLLIDLMSGLKLNPQTNQYDSNIQIIQLYQFEELLLTNIITDLVMTNIVFDERPETGRALYCNMTFEQVNFVTLQKTKIPTTVSSSVSKKASNKKTQTKGDGTVKDSDNPPAGEASPSEDALKEAVANG